MPTTQSSSKIEYVNNANFDEKVLQSKVPVLVDFYADWCGPCRALAPALEEVARESAGKVVKVNVDEAPLLANRYGVSAIPTLLVFKDGEVVGEHIGMASKSMLKALLTR